MSCPVIVPAAGGSTRCPEGKLVKAWRGRPLLEWLLDTLDAHPLLGTVLVITGHHQEKVERLCRPYTKVVTAHNPRWEDGLSSSLRLGESTLPVGQGFLVALGDTPLIHPRTVSAVLPCLGSVSPCLGSVSPSPASESIRIPVYQGHAGHPVYFPEWVRAYWPDLSGDRGAKGLLQRWPDRVRRVEVNDPGILRDFDSASDFAEPARPAHQPASIPARGEWSRSP
jgi:CTP:molybdopterin cytidylyltransferase MocA